MELTANHVVLRGSLDCLPQFSHENHGRRFFRFSLEVPRLSGTVDTLPVIAQEEILNEIDLSDGEMLTVTGQVRSHNLRENGRRRLLIFVFASHIVCEDGAPINEVSLEGTLCREPIYRRTPLGRSICDLMLAVSRRYGRADYLPLIAWGQLASDLSQRRTGDILALEGRIQSRLYTKRLETGPEQRTAYEVSVMRLIPGDPAWEEDGPSDGASPT